MQLDHEGPEPQAGSSEQWEVRTPERFRSPEEKGKYPSDSVEPEQEQSPPERFRSPGEISKYPSYTSQVLYPPMQVGAKDMLADTDVFSPRARDLGAGGSKKVEQVAGADPRL